MGSVFFFLPSAVGLMGGPRPWLCELYSMSLFISRVIRHVGGSCCTNKLHAVWGQQWQLSLVIASGAKKPDSGTHTQTNKQITFGPWYFYWTHVFEVTKLRQCLKTFHMLSQCIVSTLSFCPFILGVNDVEKKRWSSIKSEGEVGVVDGSTKCRTFTQASSEEKANIDLF